MGVQIDIIFDQTTSEKSKMADKVEVYRPRTILNFPLPVWSISITTDPFDLDSTKTAAVEISFRSCHTAEMGL